MLSVDFNYYKTEYLGDILTESEFGKYVKQSEYYISAYTFGNADTVTENDNIASKLKDAICAVSELVKSYTSEDGMVHGSLASESVGGSWSKSYNNVSGDSSQTLETAIHGKLSVILANTGLLFGGVYII